MNILQQTKLSKTFLLNQNNIFEKIQQAKVIPVAKIDNTNDAIEIAKALVISNIKIIEVTYRTNNAGQCIASICKNIPEIIVGAGTITNIAQAKDAIKSGAKFLIMPGFDKQVVQFAIKKNIPIIPGVSSPTQIMQAQNLGLTVLKLFPASILGGIELLKTLNGPFANIKFIPTGGINLNNAKEFLAQKNVLAVGGSWITSSDFIKDKSWNKITQEAKNIEKLFSCVIN